MNIEQSTTALSIFKYRQQDVRTFIINNEIWFVASDTCVVLGIVDYIQAIERLDDDERGRYNIPTPGGPQNMLCVNEPGLYELILTSRKPEAKAFKRWIKHEVLPSIRKTGKYSIHQGYTEETFTNALLAGIPVPASHAELIRIRRFVNAAEALYYPKHAQKQLAKEEKLLLAAQSEQEHLRSEIIRHMTRLTERGQEWITANGLRGYMKGKSREEIENQMKMLVELGALESQKTTQSILYKLV